MPLRKKEKNYTETEQELGNSFQHFQRLDYLRAGGYAVTQILAAKFDQRRIRSLRFITRASHKKVVQLRVSRT